MITPGARVRMFNPVIIRRHQCKSSQATKSDSWDTSFSFKSNYKFTIIQALPISHYRVKSDNINFCIPYIIVKLYINYIWNPWSTNLWIGLHRWLKEQFFPEGEKGRKIEVWVRERVKKEFLYLPEFFLSCDIIK